MFHLPHFVSRINSIVNSNFEFQVDTTKAGSASDTFILPLRSGTTNFTIDWGDGNTDVITTYNQAELTHVYSVGGVYSISIDGEFEAIYFNNSGDKLKLTSIDNWGDNLWGYVCTGAFFGCANLVANYTDTLKFSTSSTDMNQFLRGCTLFNGVINTWDWSKVDRWDYMLLSCVNFNQSVDGIDSSNIVYWTSVFGYCTLFNQNIGMLDISSATSLAGVLTNTGLSTSNYDKTLIGFEAQTKTGLVFQAQGLTYTSGGLGESARDVLTSVDGWTITDAGGI